MDLEFGYPYLYPGVRIIAKAVLMLRPGILITEILLLKKQ